MHAELPNLELIQEKFHNEIKEKLDSNYNPEFDLTMFSQIWKLENKIILRLRNLVRK